MQSGRDIAVAKRLLRKLLKGQGRTPRVKVTDKLRSYAVAKWDTMPSVGHRKHENIYNRAENSEQPTQRREWQIKRSKSGSQVQRLLSTNTRSPTFSTFAETTFWLAATELPGLMSLAQRLSHEAINRPRRANLRPRNPV